MKKVKRFDQQDNGKRFVVKAKYKNYQTLFQNSSDRELLNLDEKGVC